MSTRAILKANLRALMAHHGWTIKGVVERARRRHISLSNGTVGRAHAGKTAVGIDKLDTLAKVFDLQAWQLLVPDLEPANPPLLATESASLKALLKRIGTTKEAIEGFLRDAGNSEPGELS